jgi:hypothetical protein
MDQKVLDALTALINEAATWQLVLTAIVSVLTAFVGAYVGTRLRAQAQRDQVRKDFEEVLREQIRTMSETESAKAQAQREQAKKYFEEVLGEQLRTTFETESKKAQAQRDQAREHFEQVLGEQIRTTFETESVKNAIASATTHSIEQFKTDLQQRTSSIAFWRERVAKLKDMAFESALALDVLTENCSSVPWLAKTVTEDIHKAGHLEIARLRYALVQLRELGVVDEKTVSAGSLGYAFKIFAGAVAMYQDEISAGNILLTGQANATARKAEEDLEYRRKEWRQLLDKLDTVVASLAITADRIPTIQVAPAAAKVQATPATL